MTGKMSVSGREKNYLLEVQNEIKDYVDECYFDNFGNLVAHKAGHGKKVMFCCAADEVGGVVSHISPEGLIYANKIGDYKEKEFSYTKVRFDNGVEGVFSVNESEEIIVDIGADSVEQIDIQVGDFFGFSIERAQNDSIIFGLSMDKILIECIVKQGKQIKDYNNDLYFVFTVQSKLSGRGEKTAIYDIQPDLCYLLRLSDVSQSASEIKVNNGPAFRFKDKTTVYDKKEINQLIEHCKRLKIPSQKDISNEKDFGAGNIKSFGTNLSIISIATKNKNKPYEIIGKKDIQFTDILINNLMNM